MKKAIGIYLESCDRKRPVIGRADTLHDLLEESRMAHGLDAIDYAGEHSDHGDFHTLVDTPQGLLEYAALMETWTGPHCSAARAYHRAVARGIREAVEDGDLLAVAQA